MSTDFFQHQDTARKNTFRLVSLFILAVIVIIGVTYFIALVAFHIESGEEPRPATLWHPFILLGTIGAVLVVVGGGSAYKIAELASGGSAVALLMGGRELAPTTRDFHEKRLLNIVEEMAIASGIPVPPVYLLPDEQGINAFAAGHSPSDAIVAVSKGSINYLTRDELQGVVAHEFSHILNGDMRMNIRLMGMIHGLIVLSLVGLYAMDAAGRGRSSDSKNDSGGGGIFVVGLAVYLLGIVGAYFGQLIQAAVSRQREFLADASAVQFTRNPEGIGGALKKIGGMSEGSVIKHAGANEVSHMFFASGVAKSFTQMWDSHPPLDERIRQIDPNWDGEFPEVKPLIAEDEKQIDRKKTKPPMIPGLPTIPGIPQLPLPIPVLALESDQTPSRDESVEIETVPPSIPQRLREAIEEPFSGRAVIYALLLDPGSDVRDRQLASLTANAEPRDVTGTKKVEAEVRALPEEVRLTVAHLAMPALRQMSPGQYEVFRAQVEQLIAADKQVSLFEFCLKRVVIHHLDLAFGWRKPSRVRYRSADLLAPSICQVLGMLAWQGADEEVAVRKAFVAGADAVLGKGYALELPGRNEVDLNAFGEALDRFVDASPAVQQQLVRGVMACIMADGVVVPREQELLRAICSTLKCRMPPLQR